MSLNQTVYKKRQKTRDLAVKTVPKVLLIWERKVIKSAAETHRSRRTRKIFSEIWCCADLIRKVSSCRVRQNDRRGGNGGSGGKVLFWVCFSQRQLLQVFSQSKGAEVVALVRSQPWTVSDSQERQAVCAVEV